jgi:hypothetical protein
MLGTVALAQERRNALEVRLKVSASVSRNHRRAPSRCRRLAHAGGRTAKVQRLDWRHRTTGGFPGRKAGTSWFHPRPCMVPAKNARLALMTLQSISGSDVFGPVHWTQSQDLGETWSEPQPIPGFARRNLGDGQEEGVCDVVPEYHASTNTVLAIGHNVYYRRGVLARPQGSRWPVYTVRAASGSWSPSEKLTWNDPRGAFIYTCGCAQRVALPDCDVLIPLSFGPEESQPRSVTTVRCRFDGTQLGIREAGNELTGRVGRGLLAQSGNARRQVLFSSLIVNSFR